MSALPQPLPLQFLPAFELVARDLSIKKAAEALHLSSSAVSQQIRALEDALGVKLFLRSARALKLTPTGELFASVVQDTLATYRAGVERVMRQQAGRALRLTTDAFVAYELLIPELHTFREQHPQYDLRIETSSSFADLHLDNLDAGIRFGRAPWTGLIETPLCDVVAAPVCAPGLIPSDRVRSAAALTRYPLIRLRDFPDPWQTLAPLLGFELSGKRLVFDGYFASLRAAERGLGIALALFPLTTSAVLEGRLVTPLPVTLRLRSRVYFVQRRDEAARPELQDLRAWVEARFRALSPLPPALEGAAEIAES